MGRQAQPFEEFLRPEPIRADVGPRPNIGTENSHFSELIKTGIVGALQKDLGLLSIRPRVLWFSKSDKN